MSVSPPPPPPRRPHFIRKWNKPPTRNEQKPIWKEMRYNTFPDLIWSFMKTARRAGRYTPNADARRAKARAALEAFRKSELVGE